MSFVPNQIHSNPIPSYFFNVPEPEVHTFHVHTKLASQEVSPKRLGMPRSAS